MTGSNFFLKYLLIILACSGCCDGFSVAPLGFTPVSPSTHSSSSSRHPKTALSMAKKRRRRKDSSSPPPRKTENTSSDADLPDFDFNDGTSGDVESNPKPRERSGPAKPIGDVSVNELLSDRGLESKMRFDEPEMELPDLADFRHTGVPSTSDEAPAMGKKRARAEARRAAAIANKEEEEGGFLSSLPFIGKSEGGDGGGKIEPLKILETGTWVGIFLLVAWEAYINSPFFERAAPLAPVVYQFFM